MARNESKSKCISASPDIVIIRPRPSWKPFTFRYADFNLTEPLQSLWRNLDRLRQSDMERALSMSRKGKMDASLTTVTLVGSAIRL